MMITNDPKIF